MSAAERVNVPGLAQLPSFSHAVIAGEFIYAAGTLGTAENTMDLVGGGTGPQTTQVLRNLERILGECDARLDDVVKVNVFLADMNTFPEMNEAYLEVFSKDPPARITVGRAELALGAAVEIDCVAYKPA